jgi:hypothetical protein
LAAEFGSEAEAYAAIERAIQVVVTGKKVTGVFTEVVKVGTHNVTVSGKVIDGVARVGTAEVYP